MTDSVLKQVANLKTMSCSELKNFYITLNGCEPPGNRDCVIKRLAYRIQEIAFGGLSHDAHCKMEAILKRHGYDENGMPTRKLKCGSKRSKDTFIVGSKFVRQWNGNIYEVTKLQDGFEFDGQKYRSLSAIAKVITGTHWNGRAFFGLSKRSGK